MSGTDNYVQVNSGSGPKLDAIQRTIGANTVEQSRQVIAEPYLGTYAVASNTTSTATLNSHLLQIMGGATNRIAVRRIRIYQSAGATAATLAQIQILRLTTAGTGGTAITPRRMDEAADTAAGFTAMTLPTSAGTTGELLHRAMIYLPATAGLTNPLVFDLQWDDPRAKGPVVTNSTSAGIVVLLATAVAGATVVLDAEVSEVNYS